MKRYTSPWGIGILKFRSGALTDIAMAPNGRRFNGWLLNTVDNRFPQKGDFDGDRKSVVMMAANGTRFGGWLLNTADNWLGPVGDLDSDGRDEFVIASPWDWVC